MKECFRCGISEDKAKIYHAISSRGIVKICEDCNRIEQLPTMAKPTDEQILQSKSPRSKSVQERLNAMRGDVNKNKFSGEVNLRQLIDKKFQSQKTQLPSDLIPNFHWEIQKAKRAKRITREEFAKGIGESEANVRIIEQGFLPSNDYNIINKIEKFFGISLRKSGNFESQNTDRKYILDNSLIAKEDKERPAKKLSFDLDTTKELNISDVKRMKDKYESEIPAYVKKDSKKEEPKKKPVDSWEEEYAEDDEKYLDKPEEFYEDEEDKD